MEKKRNQFEVQSTGIDEAFVFELWEFGHVDLICEDLQEIRRGKN